MSSSAFEITASSIHNVPEIGEKSRSDDTVTEIQQIHSNEIELNSLLGIDSDEENFVPTRPPRPPPPTSRKTILQNQIDAIKSEMQSLLLLTQETRRTGEP